MTRRLLSKRTSFVTMLLLLTTARHSRMTVVRAFSVVAPRHRHVSPSSSVCQQSFPSSPFPTSSTTTTTSTTTRLYATNNNNGGFLSKLKNAIPFFNDSNSDNNANRPEIVTRQSQQQQDRETMEQGIQTLFKDAPLPVRLLGGVMGKVVSGLVQEASEQQSLIQTELERAYQCVESDRRVQQALGGTPVTTTPPFSQSSSTTSINGQSQTSLDVAFLIRGPRGQEGVARLSIKGEAKQLVVQVAGERIVVDMEQTNRAAAGNIFASSDADDAVIEAEIVDKREKRP